MSIFLGFCFMLWNVASNLFSFLIIYSLLKKAREKKVKEREKRGREEECKTEE